ncbi:glycosyltransferase 61 family protein, partial [Clostridium sp.]|uniref:glycosyltransferase family 61 protein n=1 Tax=Clostridium sp. TaxID=1506 RepID=UPI0026121B9A
LMIDINIGDNSSEVNSNSQTFKRKLYGINLPKFEKQANTSYLKKEKLSCIAVDNGIILPLRKIDTPALNAIYEGGVCDNDFNFIAGHKRRDNNKFDNLEVVRSYKTDITIHSDDEVVFAGVAFNHFGHFLTESINRLWWIIKNKKYHLKLVFLVDKLFEATFLELITLMGINKENILFLEKPTKFKKIIVPDQSLHFFSKYHKEFNIPYDEILKNIKPSEEKKIYLSRTQFKKRDCINEEYFENFYREMGFRIVYPEQLDIKEQISLISGADEIVSTTGTISHMAVFAKRRASIVSLLRARSFFTIVQVMINQARDIDYTFVDTTCNFLPSRYSANCYYIGPNVSWNNFVKEEYNLVLDINIADYLNNNNSYVGDYFKQWIKTFSKTKQFNKIKNDTSLDILKNLEIILSNETTDFKTESEKLKAKVIEKPPSYSQFSNKVFTFSRIDDSHARKICLNKSGLIETIDGKGNKNESFWTVRNDELVFLDREGYLSSKYFCNKQKENGLFLLGY